MSYNLKYRVEFYTVTASVDAELGITTTETLTYTRFAQVKQLSQSEAMTSGQVVGENNYEIVVRRTPDEVLSKTMLLKWNNRRMNITYITQNDFWLTIQATEKAQ